MAMGFIIAQLKAIPLPSLLPAHVQSQENEIDEIRLQANPATGDRTLLWAQLYRDLAPLWHTG